MPETTLFAQGPTLKRPDYWASVGNVGAEPGRSIHPAVPEDLYTVI